MRKWSGLISDNALANCLGLVDESVKHWEMDEIVTLRPDAEIIMVEPLPLGKFFYSPSNTEKFTFESLRVRNSQNKIYYLSDG